MERDGSQEKDEKKDENDVKLDKKEQILRTSDVLAEGLLYMKFIQGIPVAGIVGGLADTVYLKKVTDYAQLKYRRRFLLGRIHDGGSGN